MRLCGSAAAAADKQRGGEGRRELARRETGALISDGLTGCVDRAVSQEEEERCNERYKPREKPEQKN